MEEKVLEELEQVNYSGLNSPENSVSSQHEKRFVKLERVTEKLNSDLADLSKEVGVLSKSMYNMEIAMDVNNKKQEENYRKQEENNNQIQDLLRRLLNKTEEANQRFEKLES